VFLGAGGSGTRDDAYLVRGAQVYALARERHRPVLHGLVLGLILFGAFLSFFASRTFSLQLDDTAPITGLSLPGIGASRSDEAVLTSDVLPATVRREEMEEGLLALSGQPAADADASLEAVEAPVAPVRPYNLYTVMEGDTASAIAARYGVDLQYLLWANPDLRDSEFLTLGQLLIVPAGNGIVHDVRYGETLSDIAARYGVTVEEIVAWPGNGIGSPDQVVENQSVFVPGGVLPATVLPEPAEEQPVAVEAPAPAPQPPPAAAAPAAPVASSGLIWPVYGPISSYMDASHPLGIDIDLYNNPFAPIAAATSGTVTFAGGDPCCSYGLYVIIVSPDGIETLYAHFSSIAVSPGQQVSQGQTIGNAGCTGYCTGNHLHFEVIDNGVRVDPLAYLP
jgi:murein DD-endopeptidase MepM/ murein hydrolase activator NlpD